MFIGLLLTLAGHYALVRLNESGAVIGAAGAALAALGRRDDGDLPLAMLCSAHACTLSTVSNTAPGGSILHYSFGGALAWRVDLPTHVAPSLAWASAGVLVATVGGRDGTFLAWLNASSGAELQPRVRVDTGTSFSLGGAAACPAARALAVLGTATPRGDSSVAIHTLDLWTGAPRAVTPLADHTRPRALLARCAVAEAPWLGLSSGGRRGGGAGDNASRRLPAGPIAPGARVARLDADGDAERAAPGNGSASLLAYDVATGAATVLLTAPPVPDAQPSFLAAAAAESSLGELRLLASYDLGQALLRGGAETELWFAGTSAPTDAGWSPSPYRIVLLARHGMGEEG